MKNSHKKWLGGATLIAILVIVGSLYYEGGILKGAIPPIPSSFTKYVNSADSTSSDFEYKTSKIFTGTFTGIDYLYAPSSGGTDGGGHIREESRGIDEAGIIYTFDSPADLSSYSKIVFWVRSSESLNTIKLTLDDSSGTDVSVDSGSLSPSTWERVSLDLTSTADSDLDSIVNLTWKVADDEAVWYATYDIDQITLIK